MLPWEGQILQNALNPIFFCNTMALGRMTGVNEADHSCSGTNQGYKCEFYYKGFFENGKDCFTITAKFSRAHWLIFIVNKRADNKNDVRCSARAFSTENQS